MQFREMIKKLKIHFGKITIILLAVFAALLAADLILKWCEEAFNWNFTVIPHLIFVESGMQNTGAAFSLFANSTWGRVFLIILSSLMFIVVAVAFLFIPERFVPLKLSLVMIASGALGNLIDRIAFDYVRDFVWMNLFGNWACCNFADFWIVLGVILAVVDMMFFNELAVLPLTKGAKARVKAREEAEEAKKNQTQPAENKGQTDENGGEESE